MVRAKCAIMGSPKSHQTFRGEEEQQSERALALMRERAIRSMRRRSAPTGRYAAEAGAGTGSGTTALLQTETMNPGSTDICPDYRTVTFLE